MTKYCDICSMDTLGCIKILEINGKTWCEIAYQEKFCEAQGEKNVIRRREKSN